MLLGFIYFIFSFECSNWEFSTTFKFMKSGTTMQWTLPYMLCSSWKTSIFINREGFSEQDQPGTSRLIRPKGFPLSDRHSSRLQEFWSSCNKEFLLIVVYEIWWLVGPYTRTSSKSSSFVFWVSGVHPPQHVVFPQRIRSRAMEFCKCVHCTYVCFCFCHQFCWK